MTQRVVSNFKLYWYPPSRELIGERCDTCGARPMVGVRLDYTDHTHKTVVSCSGCWANLRAIIGEGLTPPGDVVCDA